MVDGGKDCDGRDCGRYHFYIYFFSDKLVIVCDALHAIIDTTTFPMKADFLI